VAECRRQQNQVSAIFLLTDGANTHGDTEQIPQLISRALEAGVSIYPFGFGADHDAALLSNIAERAMTPFTFVEDINTIRAVFAGAMAGLLSVVAQDIKLTLDCQVTLKAVHTPFSLQINLNHAIVKVPDMRAEEKRDFLVELTVPEVCSHETELLKASAQYQDLTAGTTFQTPTMQLNIGRVADEQPEGEPDVEVMVQRQRVEVTQTLQDAASHGEAGDFVMAQKILGVQEQKMQTAKCSHMQLSKNLMMELADARDRMQSKMSWEYGGFAEVNDAMNMHRHQRCAHTCNVSSRSNVHKTSRATYCNSYQRHWVTGAM